MVTKLGSRFRWVPLVIPFVGFGLGAATPLLLEKHSRQGACQGRLDVSRPIRPEFLENLEVRDAKVGATLMRFALVLAHSAFLCGRWRDE